VNIVAKEPTKTSRAAKDVINEIPIFQSYPKGRMIGSILLPMIPMYEFANFSEAIL
jgi:hypothetical protein